MQYTLPDKTSVSTASLVRLCCKALVSWFQLLVTVLLEPKRPFSWMSLRFCSESASNFAPRSLNAATRGLADLSCGSRYGFAAQTHSQIAADVVSGGTRLTNASAVSPSCHACGWPSIGLLTSRRADNSGEGSRLRLPMFNLASRSSSITFLSRPERAGSLLARVEVVSGMGFLVGVTSTSEAASFRSWSFAGDTIAFKSLLWDDQKAFGVVSLLSDSW